MVSVDIKPSSNAGPPPPLSAFKTEPSAPITIKSVGLIYNPVSGNKAGKKRAEGIVKPMLKAIHAYGSLRFNAIAGIVFDLYETAVSILVDPSRSGFFHHTFGMAKRARFRAADVATAPRRSRCTRMWREARTRRPRCR